MPLFKEKPVSYNNDIAEKIQRRRYQILVHSLLYYELDVSIITDYEWSMWAKELAELQDRYPDVSNTVIFAEGFKGFTGATGVGLPYKDEQIVNIAARLLRSKGDDNYVRLKYIDTTPAEYDKYKLASHKIRSNEPKPQEVKKVEKPRLNKGLF